MRVVSWNMGLARESRGKSDLHEQAWHYLLGLAPDLALLQETLPPSWARTAGTLVHGPFKQWGSVVFSPRYPLERVPILEGSNLGAFGSYLAFASASLPDGSEAFVVSVHARSGDATAIQRGNLSVQETKRPSARTTKSNDAIFAGLLSLVGDRFIVGGDWNTARKQGSPAKDKVGKEFFQRAAKQRWHDCVWDGRHRELQTWFGTGAVKQDDHMFCDQGLGACVGEPWVAEDAATKLGLSLHAPLVMDFTVESIAMTSLRGGPS